jgi:hypothetical protein
VVRDRDSKAEFNSFWEAEYHRWQMGDNDRRFDEFGDIVFKNKDELDQFIHIPTQEEVLSLLKTYGFQLIHKSFREDIVPESSSVKQFADECLFWVTVKT